MSEIVLELVTPEGILVNEKIKELTAMTESGEIGILKNHAELKSKMVSAPLKYTSWDDKTDVVAVLGGVIEVSKNKVTVLTDYAKKAVDIDEARAQKNAEIAQAEVQTLTDDSKNSNPDLLIAELRLRKEMLKLKAARLQKRF